MEFSNLRVYQPDGTFKTGGLSISGDRIASAEVSADAVDMGGLYAVPGLVDLHFHGCMGRDFCDGTHEAISTLAKYQAQIGVAAICPATMTYPEDKLTQIAEAAATYQAESNDAVLVGINMEGPFISEAKKGAQNGAYLHAPDAAMFRRVQEKAGGLFKLCDLAPELPGSMETDRRAGRRGAYLDCAHDSGLRHRLRSLQARSPAGDSPVQRHAAVFSSGTGRHRCGL